MKKIKAEYKHVYSAEVIKIFDGDTFTLRVSVGFGVYKIDKFRLYGLDTPESRGKGKCKKGIDVKRKVILMLTGLSIPPDWDEEDTWKKIEADRKACLLQCYRVRVKTYKQGKFGRYLCELTIVDTKKNKEINLNEYLLKHKMAKPYFGGKR